MTNSGNEYFNQIMRDVKITDVLEKLGFYLVRRGVNYNTLCPFHHDKNPSLVIYENTYHCFACGAHGNIFSIIKKIKVCTFYEAVIWLESEYPGIKRYKQNILPALTKIVPSAFNLALDCYKEMSKEEKEEYQEFCNQRKFSTEFLSSAEVFYVKGRKLLNSVKNDIEKKNLLQEKKLLKEKAANNIFSGHTGYKDAFLEDTFTDDTFILEDTFIKDRVIFTLRDYNNQIVGFAGRATSEDKPKYLFTKDLPKSSFLYRLNVIKQNILKNDKKDICKICITEGVFDSLRFNSLKLEEKEYYAVSVLGSHITKDQVKTLETFVNEISAMGKTVEIILFLDSDNAGIKGTFTSIKNLWGRQTFRQLSLSVIINKQIFNNNSSSNNSNNSNDYNSSYSNNSDYNVSLENEKEDRNKNVNNFKDPDEILKSLNNENQHIWLEKNNLNVFEFLIRYISDQELLLFDTESDNENDTDSGKYIKKILSEMNTIYRINVLDKIRRLLSNKEWEEILAFYETIYTGELENEFGFNLISKYILLKIDTINSQKQKSQKHIPTTSEEDLFNRAILIARDSYLREELHLDDFTWDRIQYCADAFIPYFSSIIDPKNKNYKSYENMKIPMFSAKIPKNSDEFRLKALYSHEQLILQQYVLNELLRTDDNNRNFEECIPAVRYDKLSNTVYTTGASYHDFYKNLKISAVSFAYQINMQGVNGAITGEGMFRPFYECWKSFIKYIEEGINKIEGDKIYKVRLDIRKYYDKIPLHAVRRVLITQLKEAPWTTSNRCKPFIEKSDDVEDIAIKVADWINREVFNYKYFCPKTDIVKDSENGLYGIPQGPNISAYLANIVLFPLDKKITEYVNAENKKIIEGEQNDIAENRIAVRYARYVDDMVIVSEKPEHLIKIRNIIIDELQGIDLELSTKTDEAEAINKSEAYDWLTDERGGLCVSSVDDFPEDSIESAMEKYEDFDELNRRNALMFLYNSLFDFDNIDNSDIAKIIEKLFATEELRYSDAIKLAELLIMHVIKINYDDNLKDNLKDNSKNDLADIDLFYEFNKLFNREIKKAPGDSILHREGIAYMAFLDGLIKILNPKNLYKTKIGESFVNQKIIQYIMRYINKYSILPEHCYINEENVETNKEVLKENIIFIKTKILQIIGLSIRLSKESFAEVIYEKFLFKIIAQCKNEYVLRWIYSVFSDMRYDNKMGESFMSNLKDFHKYKQNQESLQRFHYVTTRLYSCRTKDDFYDLKKLYNDIKVKAGTNTEFEEYDILEKCMLLWLESEEFAKTEVNYNHHDNNDNDNDNSNNYDNDDDNSDNNNDGDSKNKSRISYDYTKKVALKTFLNIFIDKSILSDVIIKNNKLLCTLFSDINESLRYLPVPPGVSYNGVFAIDKGNDIAKRADLIDNIPDKIADLDWEEEQNLNQNCWIKKAYFKNWKNISEYFEEYLEEKNYKQRSKLPEKIADIHNKLTKFLSHEDNKMIILSKHHTFIDENGEMRVLSYKVNNKQLDNCIAISNGSNSLKISYVTQFGSLFWKVGNLLFDALKLNEIITDKTEKNENVNKNGNEDKDEDKDKDKYDYITPMLHNSFYRLNGEYLSKTKIKNEKSYTQTVKRVLKLFEKFPSEKKDQHLFLIDSKLINNFITYRQNMDNIIIDSASYHLNKWSNTYIGYYYDDFLKIFPEEKEAQNYERLIKRRTSYAYFSIAKKLNEIITTRNKSCKLIDHELIGIEALCCGLYICSIAENLRMQVLERIISFDQDESQALLSKEFPLEFLGVSVIDIEKNNVVFLMDSEDQMKQLKDIAKYLLMKKSTGAIKDITLEGWFLLLCWVLEIGTEGNYVTSNRIYRKDEKDLKNINSVTEEIRSKIFITDKFMPQDQENKENKENEYPFEGFFKTISDWNGEYTQKIFEKLNQIDNLDNVIIQKKASIFFSKSIEKHSQYSQELRINLVSMNLDGQNISNMPSFFLTDGHIGKLMRTEEKDEENKVIWTETRIKNKIAGVSLISDKLSNLAASKKIKYDNTSAYEHTNDEISDKIKVAVSESENYSYYKDGRYHW